MDMKVPSYRLRSILLLFILAFLIVQPSYQQESLDSDSGDSDHSDDSDSPKKYAKIVHADCSFGVCQLVGKLDICSTIYVLNMAPGAEFNIQFSVDDQEREITLSLEADNSKSMMTQITMTPQNMNYIRGGYSWEQTFAISESDLNNRELLISVKPILQNSPSKVVLKISQGCEDDGGTSAWLVVVLVLGPICLVLIAAFCLYWFCIRRRRAARAQQAIKVTKEADLDRQKPSADNIIIQNLVKIDSPLSEENLDEHFPESTLESFSNSFAEKTCSICLEELKSSQLCRQLYCGHVFHSQCIKLWLINQLKKNEAFCPNCNQNLIIVKENQIQVQLQKPEEKIKVKDSYDMA